MSTSSAGLRRAGCWDHRVPLRRGTPELGLLQGTLCAFGFVFFRGGAEDLLGGGMLRMELKKNNNIHVNTQPGKKILVSSAGEVLSDA